MSGELAHVHMLPLPTILSFIDRRMMQLFMRNDGKPYFELSRQLLWAFPFPGFEATLCAELYILRQRIEDVSALSSIF